LRANIVRYARVATNGIQWHETFAAVVDGRQELVLRRWQRYFDVPVAIATEPRAQLPEHCARRIFLRSWRKRVNSAYGGRPA
jgi:hypothetical protein